MLLPWAQSQVSFLKDLVTLRNPRSRFSFLNYLHATGRLDEFINLGSFSPYRLEISDYLQLGRPQSLTQVRLAVGRANASASSRSRSDGERPTGWVVTARRRRDDRAAATW